MFELNLIKDEVIQLEKKKKYLSYFTIGYVLCFLIFALLLGRYFVTLSTINRYQKELIETRNDTNKKRGTYEVDKLEREWGYYLQELQQIENVLNSRTAWASKLYQIAELVPDTMSLDAILVKEFEKSIEIGVMVIPDEKQGFELMDDFIAILDKSQYFGKGIKLGTQAKKELNNKKAELFSVVIPLK